MSKLKPVYCYLIIILITYLIFQNSLSGEFVFDDESVIVNNQSITSLSSIPKFFTAEDGFHKVIGRYYRPIVSTTYALDYSLHGLKPYGFHLTNIIIHIISCLLLFKILSLLFWRYKYRNLFALFSTLIFAAHPVHTEAVAWISGRTDSLVTMFFFASFLFYIEYTKDMKFVNEDHTLHSIKSNSVWYLVLSLLFYFTGLLTKEMIITMPVIIFAYDFIYRKKDLNYFKKNITVYTLFAGVTLIYLVIRYILLKDIPERESYLYFYGKEIYTAVGTMLKTVPVYFRLLFAPFGLLYHYNGVIADAKSIADSDVILSALFILLLIFLSIYFYKKDSIISFCIIFFLVTLLPVMNIIPTMNLMAERFLYLTSFSLVLLVCHISLLGSAKRDFSFLTLGLIIIIISLSYLTYIRNEDWKSNTALYSTGKGVNGSVLLVNSANMLANEKKYDDAAVLYKKAIEIRDNNVLAHHNLGLVYLLRGSLDSATFQIKRGIALDSLAPDGYFQMASIYNTEGKTDEAIYMLEKLQTIAPNYKESASILENIKSRKSNGEKSQSKSDPEKESKDAKLALLQKRSYQYFTEKKYEEAIKDLKEMITLNSDPKAVSGLMNNVAMCYSQLKDSENEEKYFLESLKLDGQNMNALNGIMNFYLLQNKNDKAIEYLNRLLKINPDDLNFRRMLDSLKAK